MIEILAGIVLVWLLLWILAPVLLFALALMGAIVSICEGGERPEEPAFIGEVRRKNARLRRQEWFARFKKKEDCQADHDRRHACSHRAHFNRGGGPSTRC